MEEKTGFFAGRRKMDGESAVLMRFNMMQILYWWSFGSFNSFISAFMLSKGMSNTQLGFMLAIYMLCAFLGQFFWGGICDKLRTNKKVFMLGNALVLVLYGLIYFFADNLSLVMVLYPMLGFVLVPLASNIDTWLLKCFSHRPEVYGPSRGWAAMGFALFMLFYGSVIGNFGYFVMPIVSTIVILALLVLAKMQPDAPVNENIRGRGFQIKDIGKLGKIPNYMFTLFFLLLVGLAISPINNMKIVVLESVGGSVAHQGFDSFFMCIVQLPFFFFSGKLRRIPLRFRLLFCGSAPLLTLLVNFFAVNPYMVIAASVFNAISYSILLPTYREITEANVDASIRTTAHGVTDAVYASLAGMVSLLYSGTVIDRFGMKSMLMICIAIQVGALLVALVHILRKSQFLPSVVEK